MEITGTIILIKDAQQVSEKFRKKEFVIKTDDQNYPQEILLELVQDKCEIINSYREGSQVKAHINIRGRSFINKQGVKSWFNSIACWKMEPANFSQESNYSNEVTNTTEDDLPF